MISAYFPQDGVLLELCCELPVYQAEEILCSPWSRGKGFGCLRMVSRGELAKLLLWPADETEGLLCGTLVLLRNGKIQLLLKGDLGSCYGWAFFGGRRHRRSLERHRFGVVLCIDYDYDYDSMMSIVVFRDVFGFCLLTYHN